MNTALAVLVWLACIWLGLTVTTVAIALYRVLRNWDRM